jgi:hypothetical protein
MRVLLDECVPRGLRKELVGHEVKTVAEAGWAGVKNGELLQMAATNPLTEGHRPTHRDAGIEPISATAGAHFKIDIAEFISER